MKELIITFINKVAKMQRRNGARDNVDSTLPPLRRRFLDYHYYRNMSLLTKFYR